MSIEIYKGVILALCFVVLILLEIIVLEDSSHIRESWKMFIIPVMIAIAICIVAFILILQITTNVIGNITQHEIVSYKMAFDKTITFSISIVGILLTAIIAEIIIKKVNPKLTFIDTLQKCGITAAYERGNYYKENVNDILRNAKWIDICFVSGVHFFGDYSKEISRALKRGVKIRLLLVDPSSNIAKHIDKATCESGLDKSEIKKNCCETLEWVKRLTTKRRLRNRLEVRLNNVFFGFPFFIAYCPGKNEPYELHYHQYFLPRPSYYSIRMKAQANIYTWNSFATSKKNKGEIIELKKDHRNAVVDARAMFAYCWKESGSSLDLHETEFETADYDVILSSIKKKVQKIESGHENQSNIL